MRVHAGAILALLALFTLGTAVLAASLYHVQVDDVADARKRFRNQATRRISIPGLRGRILDRNGGVLADSRPSHDIAIRLECFQRSGGWSNTVAAADTEIDRLAAVLGLQRTVARERIARHLRDSSALPLTVWRDIDDATLARFSERAADFPGFIGTLRAERIYPHGTFAAHVLGYTGRGRPDTDMGDTVVHYYEELEVKGRSGVEGYYDSFLSGAPGEKIIRVDARGFRQDDGKVERESARGLDLRLTIDPAIQRTLEGVLAGVSGAGVVLDPRDGAVLALASTPVFNPDEWRQRYREYLDDPARPLFNRAVSGLYPPGSIFKPITAMAGILRAKVDDSFDWTPEDKFDCPGVFVLGDMRLHCWDRYGHGPLPLRTAISRSCNAYFCNLGQMLGTNSLFGTAQAFGLGARTGIGLNGEAAGAIYGTPWYAGHTCQTSIGQGMLQVTPLQMAVVCAAFANGGRIFTPYLHLREEAGQPEPVRRIGRPEDFAVVREGMRDVVETGTGRRIRTREGENRVKYNIKVPCAGKTGTAERGHGRKDTWIIAFAPFDEPTIAMAIVVENGESGGKTTAPLAHMVLASIFGEEEVSR
ncbi:MAG: hypothetical protein IKO72_16235 [Kiritimatiellae bacterium]|nr:hypothetical protein [Kiritimatiellia bacterium]